MITKQSFLHLVFATLLFSVIPGCYSCHEDPIDGPKTERDETDIAAVTLKLVAGHFHGTLFHQDFPVEGEKYLKAIQEIRLDYQKGQWVVAEGSDTAFFVRGGSEASPSAYGLWITYLNEKGDTLNSEFIEKGADLQHQHFFSSYGTTGYGRDGITDPAEKLTPHVFSYQYMDTTPWDKTLKETGTKLNPATNPIGFKGWFNFFHARKKFHLLVTLHHFEAGKLIHGVASPFYSLAKGLRLSASLEAEYHVPVYVLHNRSEEVALDVDSDTTLDTLNEADEKIVRAIADAYGISLQEALDAVILLVEGERHHTDGGLWF